MNGLAKAFPRLGMVVVTLLWSTLVCAGTDSAPQRIVVVFRFDDVSAKSSDVVEAKLMDAFRRHHLRCTWAVIPYASPGDFADPNSLAVLPLPAEKAKRLAAAVAEGVLDIAQHGCTHQARPGASVPSEFMGLAYSEQSASIEKGKALLERTLGMPVTIFVPPWNRYDGTTTSVLEALGFECLSAATFGTDEGRDGLKYLPGTCGIKQLPDAIRTARRSRDAAPIIVVVFHAYDFVEDNTGHGTLTCAQFEALLDRLGQQEDVVIKSIGQVLDSDMDLSHRRLSANHPVGSFDSLPPWSPPFLPNLLHLPLGVYWSSDTVWNTGTMNASLRTATAGYYLAVLGLSASLSFVLQRVMCHRRAFLRRITQYGALVLLAGATAYALRRGGLSYKGATTVVALVGICVGVWAAALLAPRAGRPAKDTRAKGPVRIQLPRPAETTSPQQPRRTGTMSIVEKAAADRARRASDATPRQK